MKRQIKERLSIEVLLGAALISLIFCALCALVIYFSQAGGLNHEIQAGALITLIPYPSPTTTAAPTLETGRETQVPENQGPAVGKTVRISRAAEGGLNIRSAPGVSNPANFLAATGETYRVEDGPVSVDGYTWWYLVAAGDASRNGWAVGDFLEASEPPG